MKLFLTLLAILTGFAGGDVARQAPVTPATLGAAMALAEATVEARSAQAAHRPFAVSPQKLVMSCLAAVRAVTVAPMVSGFAPRGLRIRE